MLGFFFTACFRCHCDEQEAKKILKNNTFATPLKSGFAFGIAFFNSA
jgi:hypothetical protein